MPAVKKNDGDLGDILSTKLKEHQALLREHEDALSKHQKEVIFHKGRVDYITQVLSGLPSLTDTVGETELSKEELYTKPYHWRKIITALLQKNYFPDEFKNSDVIDTEGIDDKVLSDRELKGKIVYAVSIALSELAKKNLLTFYRKEGVKGYMYKKKK